MQMNDPTSDDPGPRPVSDSRELHMERLRAEHERRELEAIRLGYEGPAGNRRQRKSFFSRWGVVGTLLIFVLSKAKWLFALLKLGKFGTLISMLVSVWAYALLLGWPYAVGFVLLIYVHEMGHLLAMRRQGIRASAPLFIPFMGAFIAMRGMPRNAWVEATVGMGGPLIGSLGAVAVLGAALLLDSPLLFALASVGFLINLFNLVPVSPLDGGRIAGAISRWLWVPGYAIGIFLFFVTGSPIIALILFVGAFTLYRVWKNPVPGYYTLAPIQRWTMGTAYFGLVFALSWGMAAIEPLLPSLDGKQLAVLWGGAILPGLIGCLPAPASFSIQGSRNEL